MRGWSEIQLAFSVWKMSTYLRCRFGYHGLLSVPCQILPSTCCSCSTKFAPICLSKIGLRCWRRLLLITVDRWHYAIVNVLWLKLCKMKLKRWKEGKVENVLGVKYLESNLSGKQRDGFWLSCYSSNLLGKQRNSMFCRELLLWYMHRMKTKW